MKPLKTTQQILKVLHVLPHEDHRSRFKKIMCIAFGTFVFAINLFILISSVIFFIKNFTIDLEASLDALSQIFAFTSVVYSTCMAYLIRDKIDGIFQELSIIYSKCKRQNFE